MPLSLSFDFWLGGIYGGSVLELAEQAGPDVPPAAFMHLQVIPVPGDYRPWPRLEVA